MSVVSLDAADAKVLDEVSYSSWSAYPECKDSGIDWLGDIPEHWKLKRLKYAVKIINEKVESADTDLPYFGLENIESWTGRKVETESQPEGVANQFSAGDVLFGKLRPYLAKVYHAQTEAGLCTGEALVLRQKDLVPRYLLYFLLSKDFINIVDSSTYGAKMPRANWDFIGNLPALLPEVGEQSAISSFLDRETARIDALIAKKQQLIDLLQEKRTALISQAVTKGLDPGVPMKDSGVKWLGEIPAHWEIKPFRRVMECGTRNGLYKSKEKYIDDGIPFIQMGEAFADPIFTGPACDRVEVSGGELDTWGVRGGDLLFARRSIVFEGSGKCSLIGSLSEPHIFESSIIRVRPDINEDVPEIFQVAVFMCLI